MSLHLIPVADIHVRAERQRKNMAQEELMQLADSIRRNGLINPITVEPVWDKYDAYAKPTFMLVAGERRFRAHQLLKLETIPCVFRNELSDFQRQEIELEENMKRVDLTWQEEADAVFKYHQLRLSQDPEWTQEKTGYAFGMLPGIVSKYIAVHEAITTKPELSQAANLSTVYNLISRTKAREMDSILEDAFNVELDAAGEVVAPIIDLVDRSTLATPSQNEGMASLVNAAAEILPVKRGPPYHVLCEDFLEALQDWTFPKFNLIHCDFPYGVNMDSSPLHGAAGHVNRYEDTPDIYFELLRAFFENQDKFIAQSAHCMFWFSMKFYTETVDAFRDAGWTVNPMPLVWAKSDLKGILPDPNRGPRQCYETALLASRGDRKIVRPVANLIMEPTTKDTGHMSEKPLPVVTKFLSMLIDETTSLLDPTCGSGTAIRAARDLNAKIALGLERDPKNHIIAQQTLGVFSHDQH